MRLRVLLLQLPLLRTSTKCGNFTMIMQSLLLLMMSMRMMMWPTTHHLLQLLNAKRPAANVRLV